MIERVRIGAGVAVQALWPEVAARVRAALAARGVALRDAIVLVPFAALIAPLRAAFAAGAPAAGAFLPRVETPGTLADALGPAQPAEPGVFARVPSLDRMQAAVRVRAGAHATALAEAAARFDAAARAGAPAQRTAWFGARRALLPHADGTVPAAAEAGLLRAAFDWAASAAPPPTDRLFALRPSAWVVVRIGGADALAEALLEGAPQGGLHIDCDGPVHAPFDGLAAVAPLPELLLAASFEDEALLAADAVLRTLAGDAEARVAVVAQDRLLVRRIAALLARRGVVVDDETGWKLSTTAPVARVLARLAAALPDARPDAWLDWLQHWPRARAQPLAWRALDELLREGRNARLAPSARAAADALLADARERWAAWHLPAQRRWLEWLEHLCAELQRDGEWHRLPETPAGAALQQLLDSARAQPAWRAALRALTGDLRSFMQGLEALCEASAAEQDPQPGSRVVVTPLARAVGRPFAHVVFAGADALRFGVPVPTAGLIGDRLAERMGLDTQAAAALRQQGWLAQLLRVPRLTLLQRSHEGEAQLAPAPAVQALRAACAAAGRPLAARAVAAPGAWVDAVPPVPPQPVAGTRLPAVLSATAIDTLRQCPYRFFVRSVLRLGELGEIEREPAKRDYGDWLHATLHRFHQARAPGGDDAQALAQAAEAARVALGLDAADMLAFAAGLPRLWHDYLAWQAAQERQGWHWHAGEVERRRADAGWAPIELRGRIDRVDRHRDGRFRVVDYKTGSLGKLRQRTLEPLEDTQLAVYAALWMAGADAREAAGVAPGAAAGADAAARAGADAGARAGVGADQDRAAGEAASTGASPAAAGAPPLPIEAVYLALDDREGPKAAEHADVSVSAEQLLTQLGAELARLRAGAPLQALGEGDGCRWCEVRGLCRRDHRWAA